MMRSNVKATGFELQPSLRQFIEWRREFMLSRFGAMIRSVTVHLEKLQAPSSAGEFCCRISVSLANSEQSLEAEVQGSNLKLTAVFALERISRSINHQLMTRWW